MLQRWQLCAPLLQQRKLQIRAHHADALGLLRKNLTPRINHHGLSPGCAPAGMHTTLCSRPDINQILNGTGAQQYFPVRLPGRVGKGARYQYQIDPALGLLARRPIDRMLAFTAAQKKAAATGSLQPHIGAA